MNKDIKALRQQLEQLQKSHREGSVGKKAFEAGKAQLEREILQAVLAAPEAAAAGAQAPRPSRALTAGVLSFVVVLAVAGYAWTGSPGVPSAGPPTAAAAEGGNPQASGAVDEAQFIAAVEQLAERLKGQPDDVEGWAMLARSYGMLGRLDDALPAYQKAVALNGQDARLLADYADTLALKNDRNLEGEPLALVERALKIEPTNLKALSLAGAAAFNRKDYAGAVRYWERVVQHAPAESPYLPQVQARIAELRSDAAATPPAPDAAGGATIRGTVRLAPALAMMAAPTDAVFIFARPAEGSRMPLAIVRKQVKDLPVDFVLDDSMAMSPGAKLSLFPQVVVSARVSKSGQAVPSAGDLSGQSAPIAPTASGLLIEINEVVKN